MATRAAHTLAAVLSWISLKRLWFWSVTSNIH